MSGGRSRTKDKIADYASRAKSLREAVREGRSESERMIVPSSPSRQMYQRSLAVETHCANEVRARRPSEEPINLSFDVRGSIAVFAPQRGIDIGLWASGSGFKINSRDGWYNHERVVNVRKFFRLHVAWQTVSMISVFIALFWADVFILLQVPTNIEQDVTLTVVFLVFAAEFIGLTMCDMNYPFGFFFWMDLVGSVSMIFDISYMLGPDATQPERLDRRGHGRSVVVVRAARAARLGARAGRLGRVMKVIRFISVFQKGEEAEKKEDEVKMARVISDQISDVLATRVAFLTICIAVVLPAFAMFNYPEMDDSLGVWAESLSIDAHSYFGALHRGDADILSTTKGHIRAELSRFSTFYGDESYGPFEVCFGDKVDGDFHCQDQAFSLDFKTKFEVPARRASIWLVSEGRAQCFFNLATPKRFEAAASIGLICFIMLVMVVFGLMLSHSVSVIALNPLERMLSVVRERCAQIFKFTSDLQDDGAGANADEDQDDRQTEAQSANEFVLLEKAVSKLAAIAGLSDSKPEVEVNEKMEQEDIMRLNFQGAQVPTEDQTRAMRALRSTSNVGMLAPTSSVDMETDEEDFLETLRSHIPSDVLDKMDGWYLDMTNLEPNKALLDEEGNEMPKDKTLTASLAMYLIACCEGCSNWVSNNINEDVFKKFVEKVESKYLPNPFHNFEHALDVCWAVSRFLVLVEAENFLSDIAFAWLMIAGLGHDLGHTGLNNGYLVEISHPFALTYNDRSPLENMHCATLFQVLGDPETNIFKDLDKGIYKEVRKGMIAAILHTDIVKHNEMVKQLNLFYQMNSDAVDAHGSDFNELLMANANNQNIVNAMLHTADVGNPMKPWKLCKRLAGMCMEEFFNQGDLEKLHGLPVQMLNDRTKVNVPNSQVGFIEFMIAPLAESVVRLFPTLDALADHLGDNMKHWLEVWVQESTPPTEAVEKTTARVQKVREKLKAVCSS